MMQLLFSFNGRIRRTNYWLGAIGAGLVYGVILAVILMLSGGAGAMSGQGGGGGGMGLIGLVLYLVVLFFAAWTGLAIQIKRWHDRDKPGIWVLINFIPLIGALWTLIECGFLDGTPGPNKYGPSPKGITGPEPAASATV
jgi:uncharacterized membrane protein YhaH (DUF805 family)